MIQRRPFRLSLVMTLAAFGIAGLAGRQSLYGADRNADAARKKAESERKSREIKKTVEAHQREVRERLNLPNLTSPNGPSGSQPGTALSKTNPSTRPSAAERLKNLKLPDPSAFAKTQPSRKKKNAVEYSPKRGDEFAFLVEMTTREDGIQKQWIGTPYFAGIFSDVGRSFAEMLCIGNLACRIRSSSDRPWSPNAIEDIEFPQRWMFGSSGVLNARTTSLFDQATLPLQISAILPLEELIFPALPAFPDSPRNESKESATFYLRGGQKNIFGDTPMTTLDGEFRRVCRIEQETSATPQIVNERGFHSPSNDVGLSFRQVGTFDTGEGMILNVDLDYLLELDENVRLTVKVRRLSGNDLAAARAEALKKLPKAEWPEYFRRIPADSDDFGLHLRRSVDDIPIGQRVSVSFDISERDAHGSRDYLARTIPGAPEGKVRVRLEGSNEELDVKPSDVQLPRGS